MSTRKRKQEAEEEEELQALPSDESEEEEQTDSVSCTVTNLTQPFSIISIQQDTNRWTTIQWESCPIFRYVVLSTDELNSNTVWQQQAYVWGQAGSTSWTDTTTTNVDHRFYKVRRLLCGWH